jgi:hypothetical protein
VQPRGWAKTMSYVIFLRNDSCPEEWMLLDGGSKVGSIHWPLGMDQHPLLMQKMFPMLPPEVAHMIFRHNRKIDFVRSVKVFDAIWSASIGKWSFLPSFTVDDDDAEKPKKDDFYVAKYIIYSNKFKMMEICKVHREEFPVVSRYVWHPYERGYIYMEDDEIDAMFDSSSDSESSEEYNVNNQEEEHVEVGVFE